MAQPIGRQKIAQDGVTPNRAALARFGSGVLGICISKNRARLQPAARLSIPARKPAVPTGLSPFNWPYPALRLRLRAGLSCSVPHCGTGSSAGLVSLRRNLLLQVGVLFYRLGSCRPTLRDYGRRRVDFLATGVLFRFTSCGPVVRDWRIDGSISFDLFSSLGLLPVLPRCGSPA
jgi:hypothetical protein